jgi:hypothetical protein
VDDDKARKKTLYPAMTMTTMTMMTINLACGQEEQVSERTGSPGKHADKRTDNPGTVRQTEQYNKLNNCQFFRRPVEYTVCSKVERSLASHKPNPATSLIISELSRR